MVLTLETPLLIAYSSLPLSQKPQRSMMVPTMVYEPSALLSSKPLKQGHIVSQKDIEVWTRRGNGRPCSLNLMTLNFIIIPNQHVPLNKWESPYTITGCNNRGHMTHSTFSSKRSTFHCPQTWFKTPFWSYAKLQDKRCLMNYMN